MNKPCSTTPLNGCDYCAPLFIGGSQQGIQKVPLRNGLITRNGTVTFIEFENIMYAVTCWHVLASLRRNVGIGPDHEFIISRSGFYHLADRFVAPELSSHQFDPSILADQDSFEHRSLTKGNADIAIRPIRRESVAAIRKRPVLLSDFHDQLICNLKYGVASGFAELGSKDLGSGIQTECGSIVAEISKRNQLVSQAEHIAFRSEAKGKPSYSDLAGFSGGPVFWTNESDTTSGFIGILYEGVPPTNESEVFGTGDPLTYPVHFYALVVTPEKFCSWIKSCHAILRECGHSHWWPGLGELC